MKETRADKVRALFERVDRGNIAGRKQQRIQITTQDAFDYQEDQCMDGQADNQESNIGTMNNIQNGLNQSADQVGPDRGIRV